jgi:hypothetical protein
MKAVAIPNKLVEAGTKKLKQTKASTSQNIKRKIIEIASSDSSAEFDEEDVGSEEESVHGAAVVHPAVNDEDDSDDDKDLPFAVEYAPSGRATCRRCDEIIAKGSCRISHVPLFRGKPGFRIYRHLECAQFTENIHSAHDVGGWRKLDTHDLETLAMQVEASKIELEGENKEISPDELVQAAFTGETRQAPPGLVASLLPFQIEGLSWMYHQEVKSEVKGGVLADEMGMSVQHGVVYG